MSSFLYSVEREYAHPVERLWKAWMDADELEQWYHPTDLANVPGLTASEERVGGLWTVAVDVPMYGMVAYFFGKYTRLDTYSYIEHTMHYTQSLEEFTARDFETPHHEVQVKFEERGEKTFVSFSQFGEMPAEQIDLTRQGMTSYFDSLENYLG